MTIVPARIGTAGETFEGQEDASILALNDDFIRAAGPIRYCLRVQAVDGRLIARGRVWSEIEFVCDRCGRAFRRGVEDADVSIVVEYGDLSEVVDLTPDIREATILAFPHRTVCRPDCVGLRSPWSDPRTGGTDADGEDGSPWRALDRLSSEE